MREPARGRLLLDIQLVGHVPPATPFPNPALHAQGRREGQTEKGDKETKGMNKAKINPHSFGKGSAQPGASVSS